MNRRLSPVLLAFAFVLSIPCLSVQAAEEVDDLTRLMLDHAKTVSDALSPIDAEYKAALEKTLQSAKESNNVDLLARAQQEIDKLSVKPPSLVGIGPKAAFVGVWNYIFLSSGGSDTIELLPDGGWLGGDQQRGGTWTYDSKEIVVHYNRNRDWHDHYPLPSKDGILRGHNSEGSTMQLTRRGAPISDAAKAAFVGAWKFHNSRDNHQYEATFNADGSYNDSGRRIGYWQTSDDRLYVNYDGHDWWHDIYNLPAADGVLQGHNMNGDTLTLTRAEPAK